MENELGNIDKKIEQLRDVMLEKYNEQISKIDKNIAAAKEAAIEAVVLNRAALVKELDDRLALIKQFPSVLDADIVAIKDIVSPNHSIQIEIQNGTWMPGITLNQGKWKVLILARKVD